MLDIWLPMTLHTLINYAHLFRERVRLLADLLILTDSQERLHIICYGYENRSRETLIQHKLQTINCPALAASTEHRNVTIDGFIFGTF
jgi:hypothetical protein